MKLYLSSKKFGNNNEYLGKWLKNQGNKLLLIFNAMDCKAEDKKEKNISEDIDLLKQIGFDVTVLDLTKYFDKVEDLKQIINEYKCICVMGGNVFVLRQAMKYSGLDNILNELMCDDNYLYIGYSAGSVVMSPKIDMFKEVDEPIKFYNRDELIFDGLNLIDYVFIPHYKSDYHKVYLIEEVVKFCMDNNIPYKAVCDGDVIIK